MPYCPDCGVKFDLGARRCSGCDADLEELAAAPPEASEVGCAPRGESGAESPVRTAPPMKRLLAASLDVVIAFGLVLAFRRFLLRGMILARWQIFAALLPAAYLIFRDALGGRSVGKFLFGLCAFNTRSRKRADVADSVIRNWFLFVIMLPPYFYVLSLGMVVFLFLALVMTIQIVAGAERRLGEGFASTIVVEDRVLLVGER